MKKVIIIPDSFKGTMTSLEVMEIIKNRLSAYFNADALVTIPIADGGEGTVDCFIRFTDAVQVSATAAGPLMDPMTAHYAIFDDTAIIETASVAGYALPPASKTPLDTTTYGIGELIRDAISRGCKKIILGLGGSCTNDAGAGLAAALGTKFMDQTGAAFIPTGKNLGAVQQIDVSETRSLLSGIQVTGMCDVTNPLYGEHGAAKVFAPQKGASEQDVILLNEQLILFSQTIQQCLHIDVSTLKGSGAAGGIGAGIVAFLQGRLLSGIDLILDLVDFEKLLESSGFVITGEGKLDSQSLDGKVISGIGRRAKEKQVPMVIVTGECEKGLTGLESLGIQAIFETGKLDPAKPLPELLASCRVALANTADVLGQYLRRNM
jgi:glycerate kinase